MVTHRTKPPERESEFEFGQERRLILDGNYPPEPNRRNRPSVEELGGLSEFEARVSHPEIEEGDPMRPAPFENPQGAHEELSLAPEELASHFLEEATEAPSLHFSEEPALVDGEQLELPLFELPTPRSRSPER
jgi:hypothetical protein